jgi:flagella basal body P-ring formation protein FlgA
MVVVLAVVVVGGMAYGQRRDDEPRVTVMVVKQLIPAGTYVRGETIALARLPKDDIEPGTITDLRFIAYHTTARQIVPDETLAASDFSP